MGSLKKLIQKNFFNDVIHIQKDHSVEDYFHHLISIDKLRHEELLNRFNENKCACCGGDMKVLVSHSPGSIHDETFNTTWADECPDCGFWKHGESDSWAGTKYLIPYVQSLAPPDVISISHLAKEIDAHPVELYNMSPYKFEQFIGSILKDHFACEVHYVGQSNDDGVDLVLLHSENPILVQVKRRSKTDATEGINTVKHLFASMYGNNASKGMIVTTAQKFSKPALAWLDRPAIKDSKLVIDLTDINKLLEIISSVKNSNVNPRIDFLSGISYHVNNNLTYQSRGDGCIEVFENNVRKYFYLAIDSKAYYKPIKTFTSDATNDEIVKNSKRINGKEFYNDTLYLPEKIQFEVLKNWVQQEGGILYKDESDAPPMQVYPEAK